jgi:hypothetical protein
VKGCEFSHRLFYALPNGGLRQWQSVNSDFKTTGADQQPHTKAPILYEGMFTVTDVRKDLFTQPRRFEFFYPEGMKGLVVHRVISYLNFNLTVLLPRFELLPNCFRENVSDQNICA